MTSRPPVISIDSGRPIWFVSDVHLRWGDRSYLEQFLEFIDHARESEIGELLVIGDLFEFWIGDRQARFEFYRPLSERIERLARGGCNVRLMPGNRDFLLGDAFESAGATLLPDEVVVHLGEEVIHVSHGDQFCVEDRSYQRARVVMRSRPVRFLATGLPAATGRLLARAYRGISERKKARKRTAGDGSRFHTILAGVDATFKAGDYDVILCGHIHDLADRQHEVGGRRRRVLTTGAWEDAPNYVAWDGKVLRLAHFRRTAALAAPDSVEKPALPVLPNPL